jgi:hypothetical protein
MVGLAAIVIVGGVVSRAGPARGFGPESARDLHPLPPRNCLFPTNYSRSMPISPRLFHLRNLNGTRAQRILLEAISLDRDGLRLHNAFTR